MKTIPSLLTNFALAGLLLAATLAPSQARAFHRHHAHHFAPHHTRAATTGNARAAVAADTSARVWVNTKTGVYHFPGERWYGNTQEGEYMTEKQAQAAGDRPTENGQ